MLPKFKLITINGRKEWMQYDPYTFNLWQWLKLWWKRHICDDMED
jgi:hypothetical protein